jgi:hypothetical protein
VNREPRCIECDEPSDLDLNPSGLWCREHELERRVRITAQMEDISRSLAECREQASP